MMPKNNEFSLDQIKIKVFELCNTFKKNLNKSKIKKRETNERISLF
jgi:hypothetical protein